MGRDRAGRPFIDLPGLRDWRFSMFLPAAELVPKSFHALLISRMRRLRSLFGGAATPALHPDGLVVNNAFGIVRLQQTTEKPQRE